MTGLLISLTLLGLVDSLNPATMIAVVFLLSTAQPLPRTLSFLLGVGATYFLCGLLIHLGFGAVFDYVQNFFKGTGGYVAKAVLGVVLVGFSLYLHYKPQHNSFKTPASIHPTATFVFGVVSTISDMPTAFPYLVALERISTVSPDILTTLLLLVYYNILYALPALVLLFSYLLAQRHAETVIEAIKAFFQRWMKPVTLFSLSGFGVFLLLDSSMFFMSGNGLF
jgi:cytochrome c biogenesis protein CcdA